MKTVKRNLRVQDRCQLWWGKKHVLYRELMVLQILGAEANFSLYLQSTLPCSDSHGEEGLYWWYLAGVCGYLRQYVKIHWMLL